MELVSVGEFAKQAGVKWASDWAFAPRYVPKGLAWHMSYSDGYWLGLPAPDGKSKFVSKPPEGAILACDWYECGLRDLCAQERSNDD